MKTTLLLTCVFYLLVQNIFGQEKYQRIHPKQRHYQLSNPRNIVEPFVNKNPHKLKIGDSGMPISTYNGLKPNEKQFEIVKKTLTENFLVNDDSGSGWQSRPTIGLDGGGNFVIAWVDTRSDAADIFFQRYNSLGTVQGLNTKANDDAGNTMQDSPTIAIDGAGNFVIAWTDGRNYGFNPDIYYQRYNSFGIAQGVNTKANDDVGSTWPVQWYPAIAIDGAGNFVIAWQDYRNSRYNPDIYYQRYNSAGTAQGVNTKANDDSGSAHQWYPAIAMDGVGNFVIAWEDYRNGDNSDIYYQRYNSAGTAQGVNIKANDVGIADQAKPTIAMDGGGSFVIAWENHRYNNKGIYYQRYNSAGTAQGVNTKANDDSGSTYQWYPAIAMDGVGNFVIVWEDFSGGSNNSDVIGQRFYSNGGFKDGNYRIVADGPNHCEGSPVVIANNNNLIFAWEDSRRSLGGDIYCKIVGWDWNGVTSVSDIGNDKPKEFSLSQNYPNPFNPSTTIKYAIPLLGGAGGGSVTLKVYDVLGNEVATLVDEYKTAGSYEVEFKTSGIKNLASGIYFYRLKAGSFTETKKMVLLK